MVMTVEPGIYVPDEEDIPRRFRGIGIRIEDDVLVTVSGNEVLTAAAPKTIKEVEAAMRARR
jgi:Xaa-Pro aminopeptidase